MKKNTPGEITIRSEDPGTESEIISPATKQSFSFSMLGLAHIVYITLGLFLFFTLLMVFNTYIFHLKVETAVVSVPLETMEAPLAGLVSEVYVTPGQLVKKGAPLLKIENIELERDLQLAKVQIDDAQLNIAYYESLLESEKQRIKVYKHIGTDRVSSAEALASISKQDLITAKNNVARMQMLHDKHYLSDASWEEILARYKNAKQNMENMLAQKELEKSSLSAVKQGMYFTGTKIEGMRNDLTAELAAAQQRLALNQHKEKIYEEMEKKLTLVAPFDGQVIQILKSQGNTTDSVKPILLIEQLNTPKSIVAYLTQSEITHVRMGSHVKIYIPSLGRTFHGTVTALNRTDGFVDEVHAQYRWRDLEIDRSAMVSIVLQAKDQKKFNQSVVAGMPAIVYFARTFTLL